MNLSYLSVLFFVAISQRSVLGQKCDCAPLTTCAEESVEFEVKKLTDCHDQCKSKLNPKLERGLTACQVFLKPTQEEEKVKAKNRKGCLMKSMCAASNTLFIRAAQLRAQQQASGATGGQRIPQGQAGGLGPLLRGKRHLPRHRRQLGRGGQGQRPQPKAPVYKPNPEYPDDYNAYKKCSLECAWKKRTERQPQVGACAPQQSCTLIRHQLVFKKMQQDCPLPAQEKCSKENLQPLLKQCKCTRRRLGLETATCEKTFDCEEIAKKAKERQELLQKQFQIQQAALRQRQQLQQQGQNAGIFPGQRGGNSGIFPGLSG